MKEESVKEFFERGGKVERFDYIPPSETKIVIQLKTTYAIESFADFFEMFNGKPIKKLEKPQLNLSSIPYELLEKLKLMGVKL